MTKIELLAIPYQRTTFFVALDGVLGALPAPLDAVGQAFRANLDAVTRIISVPYRMVHLCLAPGIEGAARTDFLNELFASAENADASEEEPVFDQELIEKEIRAQAIDTARQALSDTQLQIGVREIYLQSVVLVWGALEVLANDLFMVLLDNRPELSLMLIRDERSKRLFSNLRIDVETLSAYQFNLGAQMGTLLSSVRSLDTIDAMKVVFATLFPNAISLRNALCSRDLWLLNCRRNLIVHRRGIVDKSYMRKSGEEVVEGSQLLVGLDDVRSPLTAVRDVALELLPAASERLSEKS